LVRACGSYPQRPGFESLHRHQIELTLSVGGWGRMKSLVTWATAGVFVLSLQGAVLAQPQEKAPEAMPPALESPTPIAPAPEVAVPAKVEKKASKKTSLKKENKKAKNKKKVKKKKVKRAKKKAV
jgi:hypothetical protein